jgi:hypothetical protein
VLFLVFLPFLAVFVYLLSRARGWPAGTIDQAEFD